MSEQRDVVPAIDNVFLQMFRLFGWRKPRRCLLGSDGSGLGLTHRRGHRTQRASCGTSRRASFASGFLVGSLLSLRIFRILLFCLELVLSFEAKFKPGLFQSLLKANDLSNPLGIPLSLCVELAVNVESAAFARAGDLDQHPNRGTAKMRTVVRMTAAVFVPSIRTELHRHSPKRNGCPITKNLTSCEIAISPEAWSRN